MLCPTRQTKGGSVTCLKSNIKLIINRSPQDGLRVYSLREVFRNAILDQFPGWGRQLTQCSELLIAEPAEDIWISTNQCCSFEVAPWIQIRIRDVDSRSVSTRYVETSLGGNFHICLISLAFWIKLTMISQCFWYGSIFNPYPGVRKKISLAN
jgi:hypothetical protein